MHFIGKESFRQTGPPLDNVLRAMGSRRAWVCLDDAFGRQILSFTDTESLEPGPLYLDSIRNFIKPANSVQGHPFSGGVMGFVSYEMGRFSERMPPPTTAAVSPELGLRRFEGGMCFENGEWWVAGSPAFLEEARLILDTALSVRSPAYRAGRLKHVPPDQDYLDVVEEVLADIQAGDCYQVNLARRLDFYPPSCWIEAYLRLRSAHPAAFGALLVDEGHWVLSNSPELFLRVDGDQVETAPIKGTRPRISGADNGLARRELSDSEKEKAELTMIVDMARNDLSRCCAPGTVQAGEREILTLPSLFHAQQRVIGRLEHGKDAVDAFAAAFPPASVTGAPKVKAMERIAALEPVSRGVYTGAIGCFSDGGNACFSVAIRTLGAHEDQAHLHVGSGIVADSSPQLELAESGWKAEAMVAALTTT
jgi:para-aminobenzoate synthetase component I